MSGRKRNFKFYDPELMSRLERNVQLPPKLKCARCSYNLPPARFSNKQLTDARLAIRDFGTTARYQIKCQKCAGGQQIVEIECAMCHKVKGREEFSNTQAKKPDSARCFDCVDDQLADDPIEEDRYDNPDEAFNKIETSTGEWPEYWEASTSAGEPIMNDSDYKAYNENEGGVSILNQFQGMSLTGSHSNTLIESEDYASSTSGLGRDDDGWSEVRSKTKSWQTSSNSAASASSGFHPNKYGNPGSRNTTSSYSGSARTFNSSVTERSDGTVYKNGWAKIKAYDPRKDPNFRVRAPPVRSSKNGQEGEWDSESGSSSSSDDDDDDDDTVI